MPIILMSLLSALGGVFTKILIASCAEPALMYLTLATLDKLAKSTKTDIDDKFVDEIRKTLKK